MATVTKQWDNGGTLTIEYSGGGSGDVEFSSDVNEGAERTMEILIETITGIQVTRTVRQEGMREPFSGSDGVFYGKYGERFLCLKEEHIQNK